MGKKNRNQKKKQKSCGDESHSGVSSAPPFSSSPPAATATTGKPHFPLRFPHDPPLPLPNEGFLSDTGQYRPSYKRALDTAYEGFVCDGPDTTTTPNGKKTFPHDRIRQALTRMDDAGYFRTDVTQPFGLGTRCAKTYVTRCLLGEHGTTYKYLGLRMFSHPWDGSSADEGRSKKDDDTDMSLQMALRSLSKLNDTLTQRTESHLSDLNEKRRDRGAPTSRMTGRSKFDVTLINRMEVSPDLKAEPMTGKGKCTVSWHADSCLENYSAIGVYHTIFSEDEDESGGGDGATAWSVALRVAHDSEGPQAGRRGGDIESSVVTDTPVLSTSLPSGAAYYMLDDFNHHHQHAVLAPENATGEDGGVRFSSTHRLLRQGHNVEFVIERCRSTVGAFHKRGPKVWRAEQMLLSDTESEWIRQFYIQGCGNKDILWKYWREPMCTLLKYWGQLESRTKQIIDLLKHAAEERCGFASTPSNEGVSGRAERKLREKRKKAVVAVEDILNRGDTSESACDLVYDPVATLLEERAKMRSLWHKRGKDKVFSRMDKEYHPIDPPLVFGAEGNDSDKGPTKESEETGRSPLPGMPSDLYELASHIRNWGRAYQSKNISDLPEVSSIPKEGAVSQLDSYHAKSPSQSGKRSGITGGGEATKGRDNDNGKGKKKRKGGGLQDLASKSGGKPKKKRF